MNLHIRTRADLEAIEQNILASYAAHSTDYTNSRLHDEPEHSYRTAFQRDRDRIIHSRAFRRLKHKRQVFLAHSGDHYRTRLTHTLEVAQLSRTMARSMGLNEDLVEAIALGHDLGHTPFGHIGEMVLHNIMSGQETLDGVLAGSNKGGYKHNYQSLRVVDVIEKKYNWEGLNLTACVREGILKHTRLRRDVVVYPDLIMEGLHYQLDDATTIEGQVVAVCDEIAQRTHDLEDGIRAGYVSLDKVRTLSIIRELEKRTNVRTADDFVYRNLLIRGLINLLVTDVMEESLRRVEKYVTSAGRSQFFETQIVWFSDQLNPLQAELDDFIANKIISIASEQRSDDSATYIISNLFKAFYQFPHLLPGYCLDHFLPAAMRRELLSTDTNTPEAAALRQKIKANPQTLRAICDHIAGMTDNYAESEIKRVEQVFHGN